MRLALVAAIVTFTAGAPLAAQSGDWRLSCQDAAMRVQDGTARGAARERALDLLVGCGRTGSAAVASAIRRERGSTDAKLLEHLYAFVHSPDGGPVLDAALSVAQDDSASTQARVWALLAFVQERYREMVADYEHVAGGFDEIGLPRNGCFVGWVAGDHGASHLSRSDVERVLTVASALYKDKTQPADVRSAARCVLP
jgi:hypothetical protein